MVPGDRRYEVHKRSDDITRIIYDDLYGDRSPILLEDAPNPVV